MSTQREQLENFLTDEGRAAVDRLFSQCRAEYRLPDYPDDDGVYLICDIQKDAHAGLNHHDPASGIWWSACDLPEHGHKETAA